MRSAPPADYSVTSSELGLDPGGNVWETERLPDSSVLRVAKTGFNAGPMPPDPYYEGCLEALAFADLAAQRGFLWWQVERVRRLDWNRGDTPKTSTFEYVVSFSKRDPVAEQPTYPLNTQPHGAAKRADRPERPVLTDSAPAPNH